MKANWFILYTEALLLFSVQKFVLSQHIGLLRHVPFATTAYTVVADESDAVLIQLLVTVSV